MPSPQSRRLRVGWRFDRVDQRLDKIDNRLDRIERTVTGLEDALPEIVANAMRDVLAAKG